MSIGNILGLYWGSHIGVVILGLYWDYIGIILGLYWSYIGGIFGLYFGVIFRGYISVIRGLNRISHMTNGHGFLIEHIPGAALIYVHS